MFEGMDGFFDRMDKRQDEIVSEFKKLLSDPCMEIPEVGDTVVVSAGALHMGYPWDRLEATVLDVAQSSYKIRFTNRNDFRTGSPEEKWVHPAVVTDVVRQQKGGA